jgi:hypothetical protein
MALPQFLQKDKSKQVYIRVEPAGIKYVERPKDETNPDYDALKKALSVRRRFGAVLSLLTTGLLMRFSIENYFSHLVAENKVKVIIIPDIQSVEFGRGVGYDIIEHIPPTTIGNISATKIREEMQKKKS